MNKVNCVKKKPVKFLITACLACMMFAPRVMGEQKIGFGLSAIEEGDDRFRPGVIIENKFLTHWLVESIYYARKLGPVLDRHILLNFGRELDIYRQFNLSFIKARAGLSALVEQTEISFNDGGDDETDTTGNLGVFYGMQFNVPMPERFP